MRGVLTTGDLAYVPANRRIDTGRFAAGHAERWMTAHRPMRILALIIAVAFASACEVGSHPPTSTKRLISQSVTYADSKKQRVFKSALKDAGIDHETYTGDDGREYVRWKGEDSAKVEGIQAHLFGEPLPEGRHIHFGPPYHDWFKKWLTDNSIPFTTRQREGKEYVIWQSADYPKVSRWEHFPRDTYEKLRRQSSDPPADSDAGDVPASASSAGARAGGRER